MEGNIQFLRRRDFSPRDDDWKYHVRKIPLPSYLGLVQVVCRPLIGWLRGYLVSYPPVSLGTRPLSIDSSMQTNKSSSRPTCPNMEIPQHYITAVVRTDYLTHIPTFFPVFLTSDWLTALPITPCNGHPRHGHRVQGLQEESEVSSRMYGLTGYPVR